MISILMHLIATYSLTVAWDQSSSPEVSGYRIYWGTASGNYTNSAAVGNVLTASINGLNFQRTYFLSATAIGPGGVESAFSNEITYTKPCVLKLTRSQNGPSTVMTLSTEIYTGMKYIIEGSSNLSTWNQVATGTAATNSISIPFNPISQIAFYRLKKSTASPSLRSLALTQSVSEEIPELTYREPTKWELRRWNLRNAPKEMKGAEILMKMNRKRKVKVPLPPMPLKIKEMR